MKVTVVCSDPLHPKWPGLAQWVARQSENVAELLTKAADASGGDLLFLISVQELVGSDIRSRYRHTLVVHASDLPEGRGWSPHVWTILEGRSRICVTMLEAAGKVDSGPIWAQREIMLHGHELWDEIADLIGAAELSLMDYAMLNADRVQPQSQDSKAATYYRRRTPADSAVDVNRSIADQFNLLRVSDPNRYPAFFDHRGYRYSIQLTKIGKSES